jgi:ribosomal-protein-alanine acetyltransferase
MATAERICITLREMTRADLRRVQRIEREAYADAWPDTVFKRELRNRFAQYVVAIEQPSPQAAPAPPGAGRGGRGLLSRLRRWLAFVPGVGPPGDEISGYFGVWFTQDQLHLVNIAVATEHQGRGIGSYLLIECFELALRSELRTITLEVRPSNAGAIRLYERFGFRRVGRSPGYYADGEDAVVMLTDDFDPPVLRAHIERLSSDHRARYGEAFE